MTIYNKNLNLETGHLQFARHPSAARTLQRPKYMRSQG